MSHGRVTGGALKWFDFARSKNLSGIGDQVSGMCGTDDFLDMHSKCYRQARRSKMSDAHESTSGLRRGESFRRTATTQGHDDALAGAAGAESARPASATLDNKEERKSMRHTTPNEHAFIPFDHRCFCQCCPQPSQDGTGWLVGPEVSIFARSLVRGGGVVLKGLRARADLNGSHGVVLAFCRTANRFLVAVGNASENLDSARTATAAEFWRLQGLAALKQSEPRGGAELKVGDKVRLHSLQKAAEHNGKDGELMEYDGETGRWAVKLSDTVSVGVRAANLASLSSTDEGLAGVVMLSLRPENLRLPDGAQGTRRASSDFIWDDGADLAPEHRKTRADLRDMDALPSSDPHRLQELARLEQPALALAAELRRSYQALKADQDPRAQGTYMELVALYRGQGEANFLLTSPSRALDMYTLALRLAEKEGDQMTEALMRRAQAVCLHRLSKFSKAIRHAETALSIFRHAGDVEEERATARCLTAMRQDLEQHRLARPEAPALTPAIREGEDTRGKLTVSDCDS